MKREPICYQQIATRNSTYESYETASRDAGRRSRALRKAGFRVAVEGMGPQVTNVGLINMTLLTIHGTRDERENLPPVRIERGI